MLIERGDQICFEEGADEKVSLPETRRAATPPPPPMEPPAAHAWPAAATLTPGGNASLPGRTRARSPPRVCRAWGCPAPANSACSAEQPAASEPRDTPAAGIWPPAGRRGQHRGEQPVRPQTHPAGGTVGSGTTPRMFNFHRGSAHPPSVPPIPPA